MKQATCTYIDMTGTREFLPQVAKRFFSKVLGIPVIWHRRKVDLIRLSELSPQLRLDAGISEAQWLCEINNRGAQPEMPCNEVHIWAKRALAANGFGDY